MHLLSAISVWVANYRCFLSSEESGKKAITVSQYDFSKIHKSLQIDVLSLFIP